MAASLSGVFNTQQFTDAGLPASGYRLYTYVNGTTTQKTAYTDAAGSVAHTYVSDGIGGLYIALNARGELPAPLYLTAGSYDVALKTALGATVWTRRADPIADGAATVSADLASSAVGKGSKLVAWIRRATSAVARWVEDKLAETVDLQDFGAVDTTGSTDCSGVFTLAIAYASTVGGQIGTIVKLPAGVLKCNFTLPNSGITIKGKGKRATILIPASNTPVISIGSMSTSVVDIHVKNVGILNTGAVATTLTPAVRFIGTTQINDNHLLQNLYIDGFPIGVEVAGRCILTQFQNVEVTQSSVNGWRVKPVTGASVNHLKWVSCRSYVSKSHGMLFQAFAGTTMIGFHLDHCDVERAGYDNTSTPNTTNSSAGIWSDGVEGLTVDGASYFENNGDGSADNMGTHIRITGAFGLWFSIQSCILWATQNSIIVDAALAVGDIQSNRLAGTVSTLRIATTNGDSNITVGPNYDNGTHIITPDAQSRTHVTFTSPGTMLTNNTSWSGTPSVRGESVLFHTGGATAITDFTGGEMGQVITLWVNSGSVALTHATTNGLYLQNGFNTAVQAGGSVTFVNSGKTGGTALGRGWVQVSSSQADASAGAQVTAAGTITPTGTVFHVTGATPISTINLPYAGFKGDITLIPDSAFTTTAAGNISLASTAVVGRAMRMTYDGTKWNPSY